MLTGRDDNIGVLDALPLQEIEAGGRFERTRRPGKRALVHSHDAFRRRGDAPQHPLGPTLRLLVYERVIQSQEGLRRDV